MNSGGEQSALRELRLAWSLLGLGLVLLLRDSLAWLLLAAPPLLFTAALLAARRPARDVAVAVQAAFASPAPRLAAIGLAFLLFLVAWACGVDGFALASVWLGAVLAAVAAWRGAGSVAGLVQGASVAGFALFALLGLAEVLLRQPALAQRLGGPAERAAWEERYDRLWERNVLGIRSRHEDTTPLPAGGCRLLALGDSITWGDKVADTRDTWPAALERALLARLAPRRVEVVNLAQPGFTTANQAERLRRLGWSFAPDLLVVQYFVNDPLPSGPDFERKGMEWLAPPVHLLPMRLRQGALHSSALLAWIEESLSRAIHSKPPAEIYAPLYEEDSEGWRQLQEALAEMADAAAAREVPALLLLFPHLLPGEWSREDYPLNRYYDAVASRAGALGFHVVDLRPAFAEAGGDWKRWWATAYDAHPGPAAHAFMAEEMLRALTRSGLISRACREPAG